MFDSNETHYGRSFVGTALEDSCPCKKEACGLVTNKSAEEVQCPQHRMLAAKTIRQSHSAADCPGKEDNDT